MSQNLVSNSSFETNEAWRLTYGSAYANNNAKEGNRCLAFAFNGTGGTQYCHQLVTVSRNKQYALTFYAKRTGNVNVWMSVGYRNQDNELRHFYTGNLPISSTYTKQSLSFILPITAYINTVEIGIMGGANSNDTGTAWVDCVEILDDGTPEIFVPGMMAKVTVDSTWVRSGPSTSQPYIGELYNRNMCVVAEDVGAWIKIRWGKTWEHQYAYIAKSNLAPINNIAPQPLVYILNTALSFAQYGEDPISRPILGGNIGLGGNWCQLFMYWLCGIAGLGLSGNFPHHTLTLCKDAISFFREKGVYHDLSLEPNFTPQTGDWIYFKKIGSNDVASHVALVADNFGSQLMIFEGNWGNPKCVRKNNAYERLNTYDIIGYARPTYS